MPSTSLRSGQGNKTPLSRGLAPRQPDLVDAGHLMDV